MKHASSLQRSSPLSRALILSGDGCGAAGRCPGGQCGSAFVVGAATVRKLSRMAVDREIQALESQADELEGRNARLKELATRFSLRNGLRWKRGFASVCASRASTP